jgi:hemoglobin/transferrin/lactoferrin receptor protein
MAARSAARSLVLLAAFATPGAALPQSPPEAPARSAPAEPARLREISVTATRTERDANDVPATVTTIDEQQIDHGLVRDIRDLIRYEPGVSAPNDPARFGATGFNIRGLTENRVVLQVDGVRLPDFFRFSIGPFNTVTRNFVDMDALKRVEILRGPASSLYGSDALGGVVTYLTKDPADYLAGKAEPWYASLKTGYASVDKSWTNTLTGAGSDGPVSALAVLTYRDGHEVETQGTNSSTGPLRTVANPQDIRIGNALLKLVLTPAANHLYRLAYEYFDNHTSTNVLSLNYATPRTTGLTGDDTYNRQRASFDYEYANPAGGWLAGAKLTLYWQGADTTEKSNETRAATTAGCSGVAFGVNTCAISRLFTFDQAIWGATALAESRVARGASRHRLLYGLDVNRTDIDELRDATINNLTTGTISKALAGDTFPVRDFPDSRQVRVGAFVQDEITLLDGHLDVIPALRYDSYRLTVQPDAIYLANVPVGVRASDFSDSALSPKLGGIWRFTPQTQVYANWATGFRAPPYDDLNAAFRNPVQSYAIVPNPNLKSEKSNGIEAGLRGDYGIARLGATGFYNWYRDFIDSQVALLCPGDPRCVPGFGQTFQSINRANVEIWGVEARGDWLFAPGWTALGAVAYANGADTGTGQPLNSIDPLKGVGAVRYDSPLFGAAAIVTAVYRKDRSQIDSSRTTQPPLFATPGFAILDFTGYWNVLRNLTLTAGIFNVFDKKYWLWSDVFRTGIGPNTTAPANAPFGSIDRYTSPGRNFAVALKIAF